MKIEKQYKSLDYNGDSYINQPLDESLDQFFRVKNEFISQPEYDEFNNLADDEFSENDKDNDDQFNSDVITQIKSAELIPSLVIINEQCDQSKIQEKSIVVTKHYIEQLDEDSYSKSSENKGDYERPISIKKNSIERPVEITSGSNQSKEDLEISIQIIQKQEIASVISSDSESTFCKITSTKKQFNEDSFNSNDLFNHKINNINN